MKATGIVRRMDDLGRVVIPKEIRRTLRIREGDPLEIFTERDGAVVFRKYSPLGELADFTRQLCQAVQSRTGFLTAVSDRETLLAAAGPGAQELKDRRLAPELLRRLEARERCCPRGQGLPLAMAEGTSQLTGAAVPVLCRGDLLGAVLLGADPERGRWPGDFEYRLLEVLADFLGRRMEG